MKDSQVRRLIVRTSLNGTMIQTDVIDTGHGLPHGPEVDLFAPFTTTKAFSLGIGLWISRSIVESHYGRIWAEANSEEGAIFSFTLPLANLDAAVDE